MIPTPTPGNGFPCKIAEIWETISPQEQRPPRLPARTKRGTLQLDWRGEASVLDMIPSGTIRGVGRLSWS
jgi:hypothetical protein